MDPEKLLEDIEHRVDDTEEELHKIEEENDGETLTSKQESAEDLIQEIHKQIKFLKKVAEKGNQ